MSIEEMIEVAEAARDAEYPFLSGPLQTYQEMMNPSFAIKLLKCVEALQEIANNEKTVHDFYEKQIVYVSLETNDMIEIASEALKELEND